jgi:hypothetical protein
MTTPIEDLKDFVAVLFNGSVEHCMELDRLLWEVRLANRHEPRMLDYEVPADSPRPDYTDRATLPSRSERSQAVPNLEDI